jgi:hypothetical protein
VPDGTTFQPNTAFSKTWRLKNVGTCTWTNYSLIFDSGEKMSGPDSAVIPTSVAPGQTVDITISLTAPATAGTYRGYWKLKNNSGVPFGIGTAATKSFWVEIYVAGTAVTPVVTVTPGTPVAPATPIAGTVYDFAANICAATWITGAGTQPCPGSEGNINGFVVAANPSRLENGTTDSRTGLITVPQQINNGYIQGFYPAYTVKSGDKFRTIINCENGATACNVVFRLNYVLVGSSTIQSLWGFWEKYEGLYYAAEVDLTSLVGQEVKFILSVDSAGSPVGDRALWVGPIIYNASSIGVVASATPIPTNTPLPATVTATVATATATATVATATFTPTPTTPVPSATNTPVTPAP